MPAVSERQRKAMFAAAEGRSTLGIPRKVGREFVGRDAEFVESEHQRANNGQFGSGGGETGSSSRESDNADAPNNKTKRSLSYKIKQHADTIKKHGAATAEYLKGKSAAEVFNAVAKNHKVKEGLSYALQTLVSHGTGALHHATGGAVPNIQGLDPGTWHLNEQLLDHAVGHFADIAAITKLQAKDTMRKAVKGLLAQREALRAKDKPKIGADDVDGVDEVLRALLDLLSGDGDLDDEAGDAKLAKSDVDYSPGKGETRCKNCEHFKGDGVCAIVAGGIDPDYWCEKFKARAEPVGDEKLAFDRNTVRRVDQDGHLFVDTTPISKANVCPYLGREIPDCEALGLDAERIYKLLRDPAELEKAASTFAGKPLLLVHKAVSASDHPHKITVGAVGDDVEFKPPYLMAPLSIWDGEAIDLINSGEQKELSSAYRYRADMTPGNYEGEAYDGVMRDIVGNHVALVREGRAGNDVVVGDAALIKEDKSMATKPIILTRKGAVAMGALSQYLAPKLAKDAQIDLTPILAGVTTKNFKDKRSSILTALKDAAKGKLATDVNLDDAKKVLDMIEGAAPAERGTQDAMETDPNSGIPMKVEDDAAGGAEELRAFLKAKGMSDEDCDAACALIEGSAKAMDAEADKDKEKGLKDLREPAAATLKSLKDKMSGDKDMVTKPAMDAAIKATAEATAKTVREDVLRTQREIRQAENDVRPYVGELANDMSFDSAEQVYRKALEMRHVPDFDKIHASALRTILLMQPKISAARPATPSRIALDASGAKGFAERYPAAMKIRVTA